tara:strand:+ start:721 stop:1149 length:429 start_codon:yes stop_codon:yes gene_type:complete
MSNHIEVKIQIIIHSTDDFNKISNALVNLFNLDPDDFKIQSLTGHFENPITMLTVILRRTKAEEFISIFFSKINKNDLGTLSETLDEKITSAGLKIRISKQEIVMGKIILNDRDAIKITITIPVYVKKNLAKIYRQTLKIPQ